MNFYILRKIEGKDFVSYFKRPVHIINKLKIKLLININIFSPEGILLNF